MPQVPRYCYPNGFQIQLNCPLERYVNAEDLSKAVAPMLFALTGDPVASILGLDATPADRDELRSRLGLDDPFLLRYIRYALNAAQGQFGLSYATARPVEEVIMERLPATMSAAKIVASSSRSALRPRTSPRRPLSSKFYAGVEDESMRTEFWLRVVAGATSTRLALTALVGSRT